MRTGHNLHCDFFGPGLKLFVPDPVESPVEAVPHLFPFAWPDQPGPAFFQIMDGESRGWTLLVKKMPDTVVVRT